MDGCIHRCRHQRHGRSKVNGTATVACLAQGEQAEAWVRADTKAGPVVEFLKSVELQSAEPR